MDYIKTEDGVSAPKELKVKRLKSHYHDLFPLGCSKEKFQSLLKQFRSDKKIVSAAQGSMVAYMDDDVLKPLALYMLTTYPEYQDIIMMSAYSLLEIYLGHNENITSIEQLEAGIIILYLGYSEFENKRQGDIIAQLIEQQMVRKQKLWLFYKGSKDTFQKKYGDLFPVFQARNFAELRITKRTSSSGGEIEL